MTAGGLRPSHPAWWLATWFGSGRLPRVPGTWGSLAALPFAALIHWAGGAWALAAGAAVAFVVGIWAGGRYAAAAGEPDPSPVVIDEVAGQWLALVPMPLDPVHYAAGFVAFRLFDVWKPWPLRRLERLPGGLGIMADDIGAGLYAAALALLVLLAFTIGGS